MTTVDTNASPDEERFDDEECEVWIGIQRDTFTNWVNEKLRGVGASEPIFITNVRSDFRDGQILCHLMRTLTKRPLPGRIIQGRKKGQKLNHYEASGNLALALNAMEKDGVRLVNIGAEDIRGGNLKLILGMIWTLIRKYQIGSTGKSLPKKLMLEWINAVLYPHMTVHNFSTDWNSGKALQGVIEWCYPGTFPRWMNVNTSDPESNCAEAMAKATDLFGIPSVVSPKHFSSSDLDELSGMTYVSYFMHEGQDGVREAGAGVRSCGYEATLRWANQYLIPDEKATNFDVDWNDGSRACSLVMALGGAIPGYPNISRSDHAYTCELAMIESEKFGIPRIISPHDMADPKVDHLGPMAYVAWHKKIVEDRPEPPVEVTPVPVVVPKEPTPPPTPKEPTPPPTPIPTPPPTPSPEPELETMSSTPPPPPVIPEPPIIVSTPAVVVSDTPPDVNVSTPQHWRAHSTYTIMADTCRCGSGVITAYMIAPSGFKNVLGASKTDDSKYDVQFNPTEKGRHAIHVCYDDVEVAGSPFYVNVYDVTYAAILRSKYGPTTVKEPFQFQVDISGVGYDDLDIYVLHKEKKIQFDRRNNGKGQYDVRFFPEEPGIYTVEVYCGGEQIPGSPLEIEVTPQGNVVARGEGLRQAFCGRQTFFEVDTKDFPGRTMECKIYSPSGRMVKADVLKNQENQDIYRVSYNPEETGTHQIEIFYSDGPVPGCPFYVAVKEPQIYVRNLGSRAIKNRQSHFLIDATEFEDGTVEIDSALPVMKYEKVGDKLYEVTLLPRSQGNYDVVIAIDGRSVRGSPFDVDVMDE